MSNRVFIIGVLLFSIPYIIEFIVERNHNSSHKDIVCNGLIVLSGSGRVQHKSNTYTLEGKKYQMKDGEICQVNDSYVNVKIEEGK